MPRRLATGRPTVTPFASTALDAVDAAAATALVDTCTITRAGTPVFNEATGTYDTPTSVIYTGACLVGRDTEDPRVVAVGEEAVPLSRFHLDLPLSVVAVAEADDVTIDTSHDPRLTTRTFVVTDISVDSTEPFRSLLIEEAL